MERVWRANPFSASATVALRSFHLAQEFAESVITEQPATAQRTRRPNYVFILSVYPFLFDDAVIKYRSLFPFIPQKYQPRRWPEIPFGTDSKVPSPVKIGGNQECSAYQDAASTIDHKQRVCEWQTIDHISLMLGCEGY